MQEDNKIIIYQDDNEITRVSVRFADEDLWLTQNQLAEIYDTTQESISRKALRWTMNGSNRAVILFYMRLFIAKMFRSQCNDFLKRFFVRM